MCTCGNNTTDCICEQEDCGCLIKDMSTDCSLFTGDTLQYSGIQKNTILTELIVQLDAYIHTLRTEIETTFSLVSLGSGVDIYRGVDGQGRKEIRSINSVGNFVDVSVSTDGNRVEIEVLEDVLIELIESRFVQSDWNQTNTSAFDYIKNKPVVDGSETKISNGPNTKVTGNGTTSTPYQIETVNLQKVVTGDFTLSNLDNNYTIYINNTAPVTITVPTGLMDSISVGFVQQGTQDVSFVASGVTINTPIGLKIKGQNYNALIEKVLNTEVYHLLGNLKA